MGISGNFAGDFCKFSPRLWQFGVWRPSAKREKTRILRAFRDPGAIYLRLTDWLARAFPIEPGLCVSFPEFGNMAGVRPRPFAANSGLANGDASEFSQPKPERQLRRRAPLCGSLTAATEF
jgi:hypothetical protein